ncbi:MAG: hypothetical protein ACXVJD_05465 [Mucilaginibacter sp.]
MKKLKLFGVLMLTGALSQAFGQQANVVKDTHKKIMPKKDSTSWFERHITISQSLATAESQELPAQFSVTIPRDKGSSWSINAGISYLIDIQSTNLLSAVTTEFHRNTLTDSVQNNLSIGYKGILRIGSGVPQSTYHFIFDPQWALDQVKKTNAAQSNLLVDWDRKGDGLHVGLPNRYGKNYSLVGISGGTQVQYILPNDTASGFKGFKLRPLVNGSFGFYFGKDKKASDPVVGLTVNYSQRIAAVNTSADQERWTHQLTAGVNYYLISKPAKVSIGLTFMNGSDNYTGLKQQQYFLLSLNLSARRPQ